MLEADESNNYSWRWHFREYWLKKAANLWRARLSNVLRPEMPNRKIFDLLGMVLVDMIYLAAIFLSTLSLPVQSMS